MTTPGDQSPTLAERYTPTTDFTALFEAARSEVERKALEGAAAFCKAVMDLQAQKIDRLTAALSSAERERDEWKIERDRWQTSADELLLETGQLKAERDALRKLLA